MTSKGDDPTTAPFDVATFDSSNDDPAPFYTKTAFGLFMPLSVLYTAVAHAVAFWFLPFRGGCVEGAAIEERGCGCFLPPSSADVMPDVLPRRPKKDSDAAATKEAAAVRASGDASRASRHVAVVTGSNTGVGYETAASLVERGYDVILGCRSRSKGEAAARSINDRVASSPRKTSGVTPGRAAFLVPLDLSSFDSIRSFVGAFDGRYDALNILVNNAGINTTGRSDDGYDLCFQANFLGHYFLTRMLLPRLLAAKNTLLCISDNDDKNGDDCDDDDASAVKVNVQTEAGRVVNLSSVMHHFAPGRHDDPSWWKRCASVGGSDNVYAETKLAAILFSLELNKRYGKEGLRSVAVNPGAVNSDIWRAFPDFLLKYVIGPVFRLVYLTPKQGSATSVAASVCDLPPGAVYLQPYFQPFIQRPLAESSLGRSAPLCYGRPFPLFEMLGPCVGWAVTNPRLPHGGDRKSCGKSITSAPSLWDACETLVGRLRGGNVREVLL